MKLAREGAYNRTTFHRVIKHGDHPGRRSAVEGSGEGEALWHGRTRGAQGGVQRREATRAARSRRSCSRDKPDSGGAQFFVCVTDQPALDGQYTIFGRVSDGHGRRAEDLGGAGRRRKAGRTERIEIVRSRFATRRRRSRSRSRRRRVADARPAPARCIETSAGAITVEFFADKAPEHVRNFLRLSASGVYDGTSFHRVVRGFVIQTGWLATPGPLHGEAAEARRASLQPEFNDTKHTKGSCRWRAETIRRARQTSFFIVTGDAQFARQQVHGVRPGGGRDGCARGDRGGAGKRRSAR